MWASASRAISSRWSGSRVNIRHHLHLSAPANARRRQKFARRLRQASRISTLAPEEARVA